MFLLFLVLIFFFNVNADASLLNKHLLFEPRISSSLEYDDNIYFTSNNEVSDWLYYISPGFSLAMGDNLSKINLDYEYQKVSYSRGIPRESNRHYLELDFNRLWANRFSFIFRDNFMRSEDPAIIQQAIGAIKYEKLKYDYNVTNVQFRYSLDRDSYCSLGYNYMFFNNRSSVVENTSSHNPYLDFVYWFSFPYGFHVHSDVNFGEFDYMPDFVEYQNYISVFYRNSLESLISIKFSISNMYFSSSFPDYDIYDFSIGYSYAYSDSLNFSLGGGYYYQYISFFDDQSGPSFYFRLKWKDDEADLSFEASSGYDEIYFDGEDLGFSKFLLFGLSGHYVFNDYGSFFVNTSYRVDNFPEASLETIREYSTVFSFAWDYPITKFLSASFEFMHLNRKSNLDDYEYRDNRITFKVNLSRSFVW